MVHYTASHWGVYRVNRGSQGEPVLAGFSADPDPSMIGFSQIEAAQSTARIARPAVRESWLKHGPGHQGERRSNEAFCEIEWEHALELVAGELRRIRDTYGNSAIFGGSYGWSSAGRFHHAQSQIHRFLNAIGGYVRHKDSYSIAAAQVLMSHIVAPMSELEFQHTSWPILREHTRLFVSFGGVPLKNTQVSAGGATKHRVKEGLAAMAAAGCKFINISPVQDNFVVPGSEVEWIPIRPNTDIALMLAISSILEAEGLASLPFLRKYCVGYDAFKAYLDGSRDGIPKTAAWASAITGVEASRIVALAREMAAQRTMINASWSLQRAQFGEQPYWGLVALAAILGQIGLPGGGFGVGYGMTNSVGSPEKSIKGPTLPQGHNPVRQFIPVARLADMLLNPGATYTYNGERLSYPDIRLVYWAGGNPFHHHQDLNRLRNAWQKPETIIVHEQFWTATAKHADIVLPATTTLERNDIGFANREGHIVAMRQLLRPFAEARDDHDIFVALAERLDAGMLFSESRDKMEWVALMYEQTREQCGAVGVAIPPFEIFWEQGIVSLERPVEPAILLNDFRNDPVGARLRTPSGRIEIFSETIASFGVDDCPGHPVWQEPVEWLGSPLVQRYPLHLVSDQPARRLHSQLDCGQWSRAGKVGGREPLYMNPEDAALRGIRNGDVVEVFNDRGRCLAGVVITNDLMPKVVRMSTGSWYDPDRDTGLEKHGNPNVLTLDIGTSGLSQGCSALTCLVEVSGPLVDPPMVTAFEKPVFTPAPT